MTNRWRHFWFGSLTELALLGIAALVFKLLKWPALEDTKWNGSHFLIGIIAVVPMLVL